RFRADGGGDFYEQFFALTQEGTVADYRDRFEYLASRLDHISESALEGNFMKGLKPEIRTSVRVLEPRNLGKAMELAQLVEDQKRSERGARGNYSGGSHRMTTTFLPSKAAAPVSQKEWPKERTGGGGNGGQFKRLTEKELQEKRAKGVKGEISNKGVVVLIDSGATHNFISNQIVKALGMELMDTGGYRVMMGTRKVELGRGVCRGVVLKIQGIRVQEDFLSMELGSTDVILGMK
ncbi:uncharacterized protein LOC114580126, partial [Dendrobium catenatum]|uniref:uncharacterized protein LOC114580126 n=1 Tax=Dendrobium catenatum TaxID=906689 RepID=UPI0010A05625